MSKYRKLTTVCSAALLTLGLAACGGGGGDGDMTETPPPPPPTYTVALPDGHGLMAGTTTLPQGDTMVGDTTISCPSADGCMLTVSRDPVTGAYSATATGGAVTVAVAEPPPPPPGPDPVQLAAAQDAARMAWQSARDALAGLAGKESANPAAYQRAMNALADAKAAYDAAMMAMTVADAEDARDDAQAANVVAMAQAAMVIASSEAPALDAAQMAAKSAADAAKMAHGEAMAALADIEAIKSDDMASYDTAMAKVAEAQAAYMEAKAASDAAAATSVVADAQAHQRTAEAELAKANAANTDAMKYAGMVQTAYDDRIAAEMKADEQRMMDVADARSAAMGSYMDADADATKAEEAAVAAEAGSPGSAVAAAARDAATEARNAANDAMAAHDAIMDDMTKAEADAEAAKAATAAGTANTQYMVAMNVNDSIQAILRAAELQRQVDVAAARTAAMGSQVDADADAMKAEAAADAAEAGDPGSAGAIAARTAATAARTAADAAMAAHDAIMDDMSKAQADAKAAEAGAAAGTANSQYLTAKAANDAIQSVITARDDEEQREMDVTAARGRAMGSYVDADADATKAEMQADAAEDAAPGSPGAIAARAAATAARNAANAAKTAHDAITDGMTKAQADEKAGEAATAATTANTEYMTASNANDVIQNIVAAQIEQQRKSDIADTKAAVTDAETAKTMADGYATKAEMARDDAKKALDRAKAARTDATEAEKQYEAAKAAATAARTAANDADTAYMAALMAAMNIDDATAEEAMMAKTTAETKQGEAETKRDAAMAAYDSVDEDALGAKQLAALAETASTSHSLRLFMAANGGHVADLESTMDLDEKAAHVANVGAAMAAIADATDGNQAAGTTAIAAWPGDTADDPATVNDDESAEGMFSITVNVANATNIVSELGATRAADDTATPPVTARIQTAKEIADLGRFRGYDLWENDGDATTDTDRARVIVFTNKTQDDPAVTASDEVTARSVENVGVTTDTLTKLGTKSGNTYTGAEYTPSGETALMGTLTCPSGTTCSVDATTAADGDVTINAVTGYVFTGSRAAKAAVTAMDATAQAEANNDYLAFGLWLDEDGTTDTFGAFAVGGAAYAVNVQEAVTGTASYSGVAAGAHHKTGEGVNWFDGNARLIANFGVADAAGTISGAISNIRVGGGDPMSTPIYLGQADLTNGTATFNGAAFMGEPTAPGAATHEFDGTWSGSFFGATADDDDTDDVNESVTAPLAAAGTFGVTKSETMGTGDDAMTVIESFVGAFGAHKQ